MAAGNGERESFSPSSSLTTGNKPFPRDANNGNDGGFHSTPKLHSSSLPVHPNGWTRICAGTRGNRKGLLPRPPITTTIKVQDINCGPFECFLIDFHRPLLAEQWRGAIARATMTRRARFSLFFLFVSLECPVIVPRIVAVCVRFRLGLG